MAESFSEERLRLGRMICDAVGLDPNDVTSISMTIGPDGEVEIAALFVPSPEVMAEIIDKGGDPLQSIRFVADWAEEDQDDPLLGFEDHEVANGR